MSRSTPAPTSAPTAGPRRGGRHRAGRAGGVRCTDLPAVRERMQFDRPHAAGGQHGTSWLRWLFQPPPSGRHTWSFLTHAGGRPRTAFAIILSL